MRAIFRSADPDHYTVFSKEQEKEFSKVTYFGDGSVLKKASGKVTGIAIKEACEEFLVFNSGEEVRIGRIISINGKPGPAYDEYKMEATVMPWIASTAIQLD
jgi:hypothetical protein